MKIFTLLCFVAVLAACSASRKQTIIKDAAPIAADSLGGAHLGVCIYDVKTNTFLTEYNSHKYFVPASNTKLFSCYAGMKYLGDSLVGLRYQDFSDTAINVFPTGDPTFLHRDFVKQPVLNFLQQEQRSIYCVTNAKQVNAFGRGWAWDDYSDDYMAERSALPVYGNTVQVKLNKTTYVSGTPTAMEPDWEVSPAFFKNKLPKAYVLPLNISLSMPQPDSTTRKTLLRKFYIQRKQYGNAFELLPGGSVFSAAEIPFQTNGIATAIQILAENHQVQIKQGGLNDNSSYGNVPAHLQMHTIHSQPTDSMLKPMMHRSDNFFAEQTLVMVGNERFNTMNTAAVIDTLLKTDLAGMPDKPVWVDGSGLSRYNLFTPADMVWLLIKMRAEFGMERLQNIFPTGNAGTLVNYYKTLAGKIFAKTGTLSGQLSLSGYLQCKSGRELIFSVMVNNHNTSAVRIRRQVERYLTGVYEAN